MPSGAVGVFFPLPVLVYVCVDVFGACCEATLEVVLQHSSLLGRVPGELLQTCSGFC